MYHSSSGLEVHHFLLRISAFGLLCGFFLYHYFAPTMKLWAMGFLLTLHSSLDLSVQLLGNTKTSSDVIAGIYQKYSAKSTKRRNSIGQIHHQHLKKEASDLGMLVVKVRPRVTPNCDLKCFLCCFSCFRKHGWLAVSSCMNHPFEKEVSRFYIWCVSSEWANNAELDFNAI